MSYRLGMLARVVLPIVTLAVAATAAADEAASSCTRLLADVRVAAHARGVDVTRSSEWMAGDYDRERWCARVFLQLRAGNPAAELRELRSWQENRNACDPFYCPQYRYHCAVHVREAPRSLVRVAAACR